MLDIGQVDATTTAETLCTLPNGASMVVISSDPASSDTAYVGLTPETGSLAASDGIPVAPGGSIPFALYGTYEGGSLSVVCSTGTATVGYLLSSYNN